MVRGMRRTSQGDEEEPVRQEERVTSQETRQEAVSRRECPTGSDAADRSSMKKTNISHWTWNMEVIGKFHKDSFSRTMEMKA